MDKNKRILPNEGKKQKATLKVISFIFVKPSLLMKIPLGMGINSCPFYNDV